MVIRWWFASLIAGLETPKARRPGKVAGFRV
jgi:hypothetical protein